jgi:hypothetical protein
MDLFVGPDRQLQPALRSGHCSAARRELAWIDVTAQPTAEWIAQQITEVSPGTRCHATHPAIGTGPTVLLSRVAVVLLAAGFPGQPEAQLRALVHRYIEEATTGR